MNTTCKKCGCKSHCKDIDGVRWPNHPCPTPDWRCKCEKCDCELCENHKV